MLQLIKKKWRKIIKIIAAVIAVFAISIVSSCLFFGIHSRMDVIGYYSMAREEFHPIWKDLALHRIRKGDSLESIIKKHAPVRREDFSSYTFLDYEVPFNGLGIVAKDGKLIYAAAGSCCWEHIFFETPSEKEKLNEAYSKGIKQLLLESRAYKIHLAAVNGQDVFISRQFKRLEVPAEKQSEKYGIPAFHLNNEEIIAEVSEVIYGDLQQGKILQFPSAECIDADPNLAEVVFIHVDDFQLLYPSYSQHYELYATVPRESLYWYQALSFEEKTEFAAQSAIRMENSLKRTKKSGD